MSYNDIINNQCIINLKQYLLSILSQDETSFNDINDFPSERGIYVIYEGEEIIYIGLAYEEGRTIKKRCQQYLQKGTGGTLRKKIEEDKNFTDEKAIEYIRTNCTAKFIRMNNDTTIKNIKALEHLYIGTFNPKYND